jgi:hypothetical protein
MLDRKVSVVGSVFRFRVEAMSHRPREVPSDFSCALVYRIQGCGSGNVVEVQQNNTPWEGKLANIALTIAAAAEHETDGCRPSYQHELPHNDCDDRCGLRATQASILRHVYRNSVW